MNAESLRIADQLRRAFTGDPWHGSPLRDLLADITPEQACARPLPSAHTIWELVLHVDAWVNAAFGATQGMPIPKPYGMERDWPAVIDRGAAKWTSAKDHLFGSAERLAAAIESFDDAKLRETAPGREYDFYYLFHGIVQHSLYHGGQIAMLRKAVSAA